MIGLDHAYTVGERLIVISNEATSNDSYLEEHPFDIGMEVEVVDYEETDGLSYIVQHVNLPDPDTWVIREEDLAEEGTYASDIALAKLRELLAGEDLDMVNHPPHYNFGTIEVIDAIEDWNLPYFLGNVVKYVARCDYKGKPLEDLEKAAFYLDREIQRRKKVSVG